MRVVDTSAWIEWIRGSTTGGTIRQLLPSRDDWLVPTIVQLELVKWIKRQGTEEMTESVIAFSEKCHVVDLDMPLALAAAEVGLRHHLATADAIIYATAEAHDADILTCDAHFQPLPRGMFVAKTAGEP